MSDEQWYEVRTNLGVEIAAVNVVRETERTVYVSVRYGRRYEDRRLKISNGSRYIKGFYAAKEYALEVSEKRLNQARFGLQEAQSTYKNIKDMTRPAPSQGE